MWQDMRGDDLLAVLENLGLAVLPQNAKFELALMVLNSHDGFSLEAKLRKLLHHISVPDGFQPVKMTVQSGLSGEPQFSEIYTG